MRGIMIRFTQTAFFIILATILFCSPAMAERKAHTRVTVIHASTGPRHVDPGLSPIISELESVFKYTSYRLITSSDMTLGMNQTGRVSLPGKRTLTVTPMNAGRGRIPYQIRIMKKRKPVFQTKILLKNNSSVTIGGPQHKKGVLLFNIQGNLN